MVTRSMVEDIVATKIAEFQAKMELEEVTKKAIKLKVKPKAGQMFESSEEDHLPSKPAFDEGVEMMRELREMKTVFRDSFSEMQTTLRDLSFTLRNNLQKTETP